MEVGKILFVVALYKEAKPIIDAFDLKPTESISSFQIFSSDVVELIISGTGKISAAAATSCLLMRNKNPRVIVNIGIAAKHTGNIGDLYLVDELVDHDTGRRYFPDVFQTQESLGLRSRLRSLSKPCTDYAFDELIDMEGNAFFEAASYFLSVDKIHLFKILSDTIENPLERGKLHPESVQSFIQKHIPSIRSFVEHFSQGEEKEIFSVGDLKNIKRFLSEYYFTLTQERQFLSLLKNLCIQMEDSVEHILLLLNFEKNENKNKKQMAKEILIALEKRLKEYYSAPFPPKSTKGVFQIIFRSRRSDQ